MNALEELHPRRCELCGRKSCYFYPDRKLGLDREHPITIPRFIERFGCGSHIKNTVESLPVWKINPETNERWELPEQSPEEIMQLIKEGWMLELVL